MCENKTLKNKTVTGMIWSFSDTLGRQLVQFIVQIVLARLILPEDFGLIGMVTVFITLSQVFVDSGFTKGLIREKKSTQEDYSTVFLFNLLIAVIIYIILFNSAGLIANFFGEPKLVSIIRVLSLVLIINSFGLIQRTILIKELKFKLQTKISFISSILSGVIAIIFALLGFGVWSLVIKTLVLQFLQALLLSVVNRWKPTLTFSITAFKRLFGFGWKLLASSLISKLYKDIFYLVMGRVFSATELGFYTNARKIKDAAANSIANSVQKVSYPVLSNIQEDKKRLKEGYKKLIKNSAYITFPALLGLSAIAPSLFRVLLGENWIPSIPYFQILCLTGMLYPIHAINLNILQVKGHSDLFLKIEIIKRLLGLTIIALVILWGLGILGLLWAGVFISYISAFINAYHSKRLANYSILEQMKDLKGIYLTSILMAIIVYSLGSIIPLHDFFILFIQIITGVLLYILFSLIFKLEEFNTIHNIIKQILNKYFPHERNEVNKQ